MSRKLLITTVALGAALLCSPAFAAGSVKIIDLVTDPNNGPISPGNYGSNSYGGPALPSSGYFRYDYIFSITNPGYVSATVTIASSDAKHLPTLGTVENHQNTVWEIYAGGTPALSNSPILTTFLAASTGGASGGITNLKLAAGTYYAEFEGTSNFALKPAISISASPVPNCRPGPCSAWALPASALLARASARSPASPPDSSG